MIIIPARLQSTRFPRKMLTDILGIPMIVRTALRAKEADEVCVATDSQEIIEVCQKHKIEAVMTSPSHSSGTDRCAEASRLLGLSESEIIINMQGDEPFLESEILLSLKKMMSEKSCFMGTCIKSISSAEAEDPNLVKVVLDKDNHALYFSRSLIPYNRDGGEVEYFGHLGIYAFSNASLQEYCTLPKSPLEEIEKLEQLRALYHQKSIATLLVQTQSMGIDTLEDKERAIKLFS